MTPERSLIVRLLRLALFVVGAISMLWLLFEMSQDVIAHLEKDRIEATGKFVFVSKSSVVISYEVAGRAYIQTVPRGIVRFEFPRRGEDRKILISKNDLTHIALDPPIGGWFFWCTDLILIVGFFVGTFFYFRYVRSQ